MTVFQMWLTHKNESLLKPCFLPLYCGQAIEEFGAERIGHGYRVLEDEAIYKLAREKNVHFEVSHVIIT